MVGNSTGQACLSPVSTMVDRVTGGGGGEAIELQKVTFSIREVRVSDREHFH